VKTELALLLSLMFIASLPAQIVPPHATVAGITIGEWTATYNQWQLLQPTNQNPAFDTDGSRANNGQSGPVFFVTGGFYSGPQPPRSYPVPEDKYLLIPLIVIEVDNIDTVPPLTVQELRDVAAVIIDTTTELHLSIDRVPVPNLFDHREVSPVFSFTIPSADNLFSFFYGHPITGINDPAVADGYWLMLSPLSLGTHAIIFGGTYGVPNSYSYERTDYITVVPIPLPQRVDELIASVGASTLAQHRQQPLLASLNAVKASFESTNLIAGINQLSAFQNKVRAQVGPSDPALADQLSQATQKVIDRAKTQLNQP